MATTIDPAKRLIWARLPENQDRVYVFMLNRATEVLQEATPDAQDLLLASAIVTKSVNIDMLLVSLFLANEAAIIGTALDDDTTVTDSNIHYAINDSDKFNIIAEAYNNAGIFS